MISKVLRVFILMAIMTLPIVSQANTKEPIFINLATNDPNKLLMALDAGRQYSEKGFPLVIYLNDRAVVFGVLDSNGKLSKSQEALKKAIGSGAVVNICPTCLEKYGFTHNNVMSGVMLGAEH